MPLSRATLPAARSFSPARQPRADAAMWHRVRFEPRKCRRSGSRRRMTGSWYFFSTYHIARPSRSAPPLSGLRALGLIRHTGCREMEYVMSTRHSCSPARRRLSEIDGISKMTRGRSDGECNYVGSTGVERRRVETDLRIDTVKFRRGSEESDGRWPPIQGGRYIRTAGKGRPRSLS